MEDRKTLALWRRVKWLRTGPAMEVLSHVLTATCNRWKCEKHDQKPSTKRSRMKNIRDRGSQLHEPNMGVSASTRNARFEREEQDSSPSRMDQLLADRVRIDRANAYLYLIDDYDVPSRPWEVVDVPGLTSLSKKQDGCSLDYPCTIGDKSFCSKLAAKYSAQLNRPILWSGNSLVCCSLNFKSHEKDIVDVLKHISNISPALWGSFLHLCSIYNEGFLDKEVDLSTLTRLTSTAFAFFKKSILLMLPTGSILLESNISPFMTFVNASLLLKPVKKLPVSTKHIPDRKSVV